MEPGAAETVSIGLVAPPEPGDYRVELDMVREGVAWFSSREPSSVTLDLTVT
jgi:hypothetical protein